MVSGPVYLIPHPPTSLLCFLSFELFPLIASSPTSPWKSSLILGQGFYADANSPFPYVRSKLFLEHATQCPFLPLLQQRKGSKAKRGKTMKFWAGIFCLLTACAQSDSPHPESHKPSLPSPTVNETLSLSSSPSLEAPQPSKEFLKEHADVLDHPWVSSQKEVTQLSPIMIEDIRSLKRLHDHTPFFGKDFLQASQKLGEHLQAYQKQLAPFSIHYPAHRYSCLNLPEASSTLYQSPTPFRLYHRMDMGVTELGLPIYLDTRIFDEVDESLVEEIEQWHLHLLKGGKASFDQYLSGGWTIWIGRGEKDSTHLDNTHGMLTADRGVFFAHKRIGSRCAVLYLETQWELLEPRLPTCKGLLPDPWAKVSAAH